MAIKIISSLTLILLLFSCGNSAKNQALELNNGEKWEIIESMAVYVRAMEKDVSKFENSAEKDYSILTEKLEKNIGLLTSNCTMKGKAHDELHKWLLPYIDSVKKLAGAKNEAEKEKIYRDIQGAFVTYNQYFR